MRKFVFKSSAHFYGCERDDPAYFTEAMAARTRRARRSSGTSSRPSAPSPSTASATPTWRLRCCASSTHSARISPRATRRCSSLPAVPAILGFDPRYQFIDEDDIAGVLEHATLHDVPGTYNAAGDGVLALSEVASLLGKPLAPLLPPWGTGLATGVLRRAGVRIPPEMLQQLRYGRALDNRRLKAAGYAFRATSRETVQAFAEHLRVRALRAGQGAGYRYEREVEEFLRWSPAVRGNGPRSALRWGRPSALATKVGRSRRAR